MICDENDMCDEDVCDEDDMCDETHPHVYHVPCVP